MSNNYLLIGTAGHVDHGKTQLIQALTGINTDRLKEEKERGISIELGFAYLTLPDGRKAGIVDVPGHEKFVRQMVAGATGMDVVLLVVAADEGVMPQTREHLDILNLLHIDKGIVVITKIDLVDQEWLSLVEEELRKELSGSTLANAPFCKVSSLTGEGIPELLQTIVTILTKGERDRKNLPARMPIDRVFSIQGFGTVVTGTLYSGYLEKGQEVMLEPGGKLAKIRNIQVHGEQVARASAGQRAAINISNLAVKDIKRGSNLVLPGYYQVGQVLDVELTNIAREKRGIKQRQRIHFHLGTAETIGRIHLLTKEELLPGENALAQIILEEPLVAAYGDRFVIRYYSPVITIGGGRVLGIAPVKRKRFKEKDISDLRLLAEGRKQELIALELKYPLTREEIRKACGAGEEEVKHVLNELAAAGRLISLKGEGSEYYWLKEAALAWGKKVSAEVARFQELFPLRGGINREELKRKLGMEIPLKNWQLSLDWAANNGFLRLTGNLVEALPEIPLPESIRKELESLMDLWEKGGLNPPAWEEGMKACGLKPENKPGKNQSGGQEKFQEMAAYLVAKGFWLKIGENYLSSTAVARAKSILEQYLREQGKVTVGEARDLWQTSRKFALPLLEYFDAIHFTKRQGDVRVLAVP
ncbi:MAG TPA: selenocysteine-specific translation elongation factor [Peptococcaceae bacterium]|nr:selenocysteine-specific translation elongation factor [Peptococcaceae bacterium]